MRGGGGLEGEEIQCRSRACSQYPPCPAEYGLPNSAHTPLRSRPVLVASRLSAPSIITTGGSSTASRRRAAAAAYGLADIALHVT